MKKKIYIVIIALIMIIGVVSSSYAYLKAEKASTNPNNLTLSNFGVVLLSDITNVSMDNLYPMDDSEGLLNTPTTFQIKNTGTIPASYQVSLVDKENVVSTMLNRDIRYQVKRTSSVTGETETLEIANLSDFGTFVEGNISPNEIITFELVLWIDYNANPNGLTFSKTVLVEGMQVSNLDKSGANYPEMSENMIPVYYDKVSDTEGVWRIADSKNLDENYKWFDYEEFMWANAVTVHKDKMDDYNGYSGPAGVTSKDFQTNIETNEEITETKSITTYTSGGKNVNSANSVATFTFQTTGAGKLSFDYTVSSESCCDKLTIILNDGTNDTTVVSSIGGEVSSSKEVNLNANTSYTLKATYKKDSSVNTGADAATISNINITSTLSSPLTHTDSTSATYPWTTTTNDVTTTTPAKKQLASTTYTYDETSGIFTLTNPSLTAYTSSSVGMYTCNSDTKTSCSKLYEIKTVDSNNIVTSVDIHTGTVNAGFRKELGMEVKMEDITTMWVWIPRYKYVMLTGLNEPSEEQLINIEFEHGIDSTGTITCVDNILTASDSASSETCTDSTYGSIIKGKSTYTHPAFTFGDEELTGFWMAKFEMSTDDATCINNKNSTKCNKIGLNTLIKPSVDALNYQSISTEFANIRRMELTDNIHGFPQGENVVSHLDSNSYLTGDLANDSNKLDIHMQKNMEWGAVAYLSQSRYGKWNNSLYSGDYRRVYKNNYYTSTNYVYRTGYSSGKYNGSSSTSTSSTFIYNDMTIAAEGQGYRGAGASTTGTVYGVYDTNGGLHDYVMGNMVNSSGNFYPSSAGTWATSTSGNIPNAKYYDKYSYNTNSNSIVSKTRGKLGDGTKEATTNFGSATGGWGGVYRYMPYSSNSWFIRGGYANFSYYGVFHSSFDIGTLMNNGGSRPVLVFSREFPWLSEKDRES